MKPLKNNELLPLARSLRRDMTPQERKLWYLFLRKYPVKIYKQRIIGSYIVDFYCAEARLVIEIDGSQHFERDGMEYDALRSADLEKYGLMILRFSNREMNEQFSGVCEEIDRVIRERRPSPSPPDGGATSPKGGGKREIGTP